MYCKDCHYDLRGLGEGDVCPECGRGFCVGDLASYDLYEKGRQVWGDERKRLFCKRYVRWIVIHFFVFLLMCLFRWFYYERFVAMPEWLGEGVIGALVMYCFVSFLVGMVGTVGSLFMRAGLKIRYLLYYPLWIGMVLFLLNEGFGREAWRRERMVGHGATRFPRVMRDIAMECGVPESWVYEDVLDWIDEKISAGEIGRDSVRDYRRIREYNMKYRLLSIDEDGLVRYRYLGRNRIDNGGLRDDYDFTIRLKVLREFSEYGKKERERD